MIQNSWRLLLSHPVKPARAVLSVYLDIDQGRQANLNRGFETQFHDMTSSLEKTVTDSAELERLRKAVRHMTNFLKTYEPRGRTLVMFFDEIDDSFWREEFRLSLQNQCRWDRGYFLNPLAAATDDFERYGVALVDRANIRLFTVCLGDIEEVPGERFDPMKVRHIKSIGNDRWSSASKIQSRADEQVRQNLRRMVRDLDALVRSNGIDRLLLAGSPEVLSNLRALFPKRLAMSIIGTLDLPIEISVDDVLNATLPITLKYERDTETQLVTKVTTAAAKATRAVVGLSATLKKVHESRVWQLIYSENFHASGYECSQCRALYSLESAACMYCGSPLVAVPDVVEKAVEEAIRKDAHIEIVRDEAASLLDNAGGIGAFLKVRTSRKTA